MEVRPARPGDELAIARVHVRTWQVAYRGHVPDEFLDGLSVDTRAEAWRRILAESDLPTMGAFVLVEGEAAIAGFVHVCPSRDEDAGEDVGEVTAIYVSPELWGRGAGRLLMKRATDSLRGAGFTEATLWVLDTNARARQFYESGGWSADGAEKVDDRPGFRMVELRYRRRISV
jgi:GNAT superfamily N-acetyltransferase